MCGASDRRPGPRQTETSGPTETEALGARLAGELVAGDVVLVAGDVGAGKTTLIRGACRALGVAGPVVSPTFTIANLYESATVRVAHLDLYRLGSLEREAPEVLEDYLGADRIAFVEWPDRAGAALGRPARLVSIEHAGGDRRRIHLGET